MENKMAQAATTNRERGPKGSEAIIVLPTETAGDKTEHGPN